MNGDSHVLIFGRNGQVGSALIEQLAAEQGFVVHSTDIDDLDLTDSVATREMVLDSAPRWVINTSAHTAVDRAETEESLAHALNAEAPDVIARACAECGAAMIHYSTDYVFDGSARSPYHESDTPNPQSVYGRTKLAGEQAVQQALDQFLIFRTAWVYSRDGRNFVNTMLRLAAERDQLSVVSDQFGSPTLSDDLAAVTIAALKQLNPGLQQSSKPGSFRDDRFGLYHATGSGVTNWAEFSETIMELSGNDHVTVNPIPTEEYPTPAPRPAYSVLSNARLKQQFGLSLPHWRDALGRCLGTA